MFESIRNSFHETLNNTFDLTRFEFGRLNIRMLQLAF